VLIRSARADDAPSLVELYAAWSHPQPETIISERLAVWQETERARVLVAELDGAIAGVAAVSATPHFARSGSFARLVGLAVSDRFRRRGVASALVRAAQSLAREWGCDRLEATSTRARDEAPHFYAALGFQDASDRQARYVCVL
jgi:N-acetylglutamate synthase-like GNAT family acetyltransferase